MIRIYWSLSTEWEQKTGTVSGSLLPTSLAGFHYTCCFFIKSLGWKKGLGLILLTALLVTFSDQFTVFLKNYFERLRPNRDPSINEVIRILKNNSSFSFVSGHATTSTAVTLLMHLTLKKYYKYTLLFFIWPLLFSYSRMYLGVHFPLDVTMGAILGLMIGYLFYVLSLKLLNWIEKKY